MAALAFESAELVLSVEGVWSTGLHLRGGRRLRDCANDAMRLQAAHYQWRSEFHAAPLVPKLTPVIPPPGTPTMTQDGRVILQRQQVCD
jgi:hypothetical protein